MNEVIGDDRHVEEKDFHLLVTDDRDFIALFMTQCRCINIQKTW
jgi:hypothetical protein